MSLIRTFVIGSILFLTPSVAHTVQLGETTTPNAAGEPDLTGTITKATVRIKPPGHKLVVKPTICNDGTGFVSLLLAFDQLQISGPGTYTLSATDDVFSTRQARLRYCSQPRTSPISHTSQFPFSQPEGA